MWASTCTNGCHGSQSWTLGPKTSRVSLAIPDTGPGIAPDIREPWPDADDRHDGHERVAEGVDVGDRALGEALGLGRADVVLLEGVQHARAADPGDQRRLI